MPIDPKMKDFVVRFLKEHLSSFHYYHNHEHTLYVLDQAIEIGKKEHCTEEELVLIGTAALWHDTGYCITYQGHEAESCRLARHYLPDYGFSKEQAGIICGMIMATRLPQTPGTKLEEILADADLEYLGTPDYENQAERLYREMKAVRPGLTEMQWREIQADFLRQHHYFTAYCRENRTEGKQKQLSRLLLEIS